MMRSAVLLGGEGNAIFAVADSTQSDGFDDEAEDDDDGEGKPRCR